MEVEGELAAVGWKRSECILLAAEVRRILTARDAFGSLFSPEVNKVTKAERRRRKGYRPQGWSLTLARASIPSILRYIIRASASSDCSREFRRVHAALVLRCASDQRSGISQPVSFSAREACWRREWPMRR